MKLFFFLSKEYITKNTIIPQRGELREKSLVIKEDIWYHRYMPDTTLETSHYERQNAVISYCFLGVFMLMSRQERFQSIFVRSHARIASVIHLWFLLLVIGTIYSHNFSSMLIFDFSLSNMSYFVGFGILFASLGAGIIRSLQWKKPNIELKSISLKEIARHVTPTGVESIEKVPMALSHVPLIGNLIAAKYGLSFYSGERFATWSLLVGILLLWLDPSMTLMILWSWLVILWIIYQSISLAIDDSISLIGEHLPESKTVHIYLLTLITYSHHLVSHTHGSLPEWWNIRDQIKENYVVEKKEKVGEILAFPLVNIGYIIKNIHTIPVRSEVLQGCLITFFFIISVIIVSPSLIFFVLFISYVGFLSLRYQRTLAIPVIKELASLIIRCINWLSKKSKKETVSLIS